MDPLNLSNRANDLAHLSNAIVEGKPLPLSLKSKILKAEGVPEGH